MKSNAQTIQIFLPDGNPKGIRVADILSRTVKAVLFPRSQFDYMLERKELENVGFYFLFGRSEDGSDLVYIGEAEDCAKRLKDHQREKDFWNFAVAIVSKTHSLTKTHVKFLEYYSILKTIETSRYKLENAVTPSKPYVTESMEAEALDSFDTTKILLTTLGFPLFESISRESISQSTSEVFFLKGKNIDAVGNLIDEGFVVFKSSQAKISTAESCHKSIIDLRQILIDNGTIILKDDSYIFTKDYVFSSPSTASDVILGHSANGWTRWKNLEGKTLDEVKRKVE